MNSNCFFFQQDSSYVRYLFYSVSANSSDSDSL